MMDLHVFHKATVVADPLLLTVLPTATAMVMVMEGVETATATATEGHLLHTELPMVVATAVVTAVDSVAAPLLPMDLPVVGKVSIF